MKKGFTLVELIVVIALLALVSLLVISYMTNNVSSRKEQLSDAFKEIIYNASDIYIGYNSNNYSKVDGNVYCIKFSDLVDVDILTSPLLDPITNEEVSLDNYVKLEVDVDKYLYSIVDSCTEKR